jgi:hypothetical protein
MHSVRASSPGFEKVAIYADLNDMLFGTSRHFAGCNVEG